MADKSAAHNGWRGKDYALHLFMRLHDVSLLFVYIVKYVTEFLDLIEVPSLKP